MTNAEIPTLKKIVDRNQVWPVMAEKYGVTNPLPPWKTSLDGMCDALDKSVCEVDLPDFKERRDEEDELSASVYANLPYPENQLVALAHSLMKRGIIGEREMQEKLRSIRARLEAE